MAESDLNGIKVLVTRPEHQAQGLCQALEDSGATPLPFPVIEIADPQDPAATINTLKKLEQYQWLIFISTNAVEHAMAMLQEQQLSLPDGLRIAAVGRSTADKLAELKVSPVVTPTEQFNSEALLALPEFSEVAGQKVLIVRGEGGRETLADTLKQRGAVVEYLEVYRRRRPNKRLDGLDKQGIKIAILTSNQGLDHLWQMASRKQQAWLKRLPLVVMSERNLQHARQLGYQADIVVAQQQSDQGLLAALKQWQQSQQQEKQQMSSKQTQQQATQNKALPDKATTTSKPPSKPQQKPARSYLSVVLSVLVGAGAAVGGYQLWQQQQHQAQKFTQQFQQLNSDFSERMQRLSNELAASENKQQATLAELSKLQTESGLLWKNLREMQQQNGHDKRPWQLAEAAYLMRLANHRLQLERDVTGAIAGLQAADRILKQVADPLLLSVREQLSREMTQLKLIEQLDREGLSAQLITLAEGARQLPIKGLDLLELQQPAVPSPAEPELDGWQGALERVWSELRSLVVITRNDQPVAPLIPADQRSYLYHNIELQLESARLAMLQADQKSWLSSLSYARSWLYDYFDHQMPSVKNSIDLLRELEKVDVAPVLPDISGSLRALKVQQQRLADPARVTSETKSEPTP